MANAKRAKRVNRRIETPLKIREGELRRLALQFYELYPMTRIIENSYVLSRFWAWYAKIELRPELRVPVPRFLTYRDP